MGDAELLRGSFAGYAYDPHTHDRACLALITRGAIRIRMRGREFTARAGDLYAIDAEEPHAGWPVDGDGWRLRTLYVDIAAMQTVLECADGRLAGLAGPIIRDPQVTRIFAGLHRGSEDGRSRLWQAEQFACFAARLLARHACGPLRPPVPGREDAAIRAARDYLESRLDDRVRLAEVAAAAGLPPFRLFRAFERQVGLTPHGYQRQIRLRRATAMIRAGRPLGDIAASCGYADQAHLTRSFRRSLGVTPGAYRTAWQAPSLS
ncbi:AraC family ligand binding domain-containing protein [Marinibaculum pumilum]|uniref:AraC family ligand binding domain-containing protein n=1 Tax=Marinibaculum pumilum TaxID=1766165 RepID=A0ABV7KZJ0_9PROT